MAELIGNIVLLFVAIIALKSFATKNPNVATKARHALQNLDANIEARTKTSHRINNPQLYCNAADFLILAAICKHPATQPVLDDLNCTTERAAVIRKRLMHELQDR
jgi:hypothetical protein